MLKVKNRLDNSDNCPTSNWQAFVLKLQQYIAQTEVRTNQGYALNTRMPSQQELDLLVQECIELTKQIHGKPNVSIVFKAFIEMSEIAGITFYKYSQIKFQNSKDQYLKLFDIKNKLNLTKEYQLSTLATHLARGGINWSGKSPIDNSTLSNILTISEYRKLILQNKIYSLILNFINRRRRNNSQEILTDSGQLPDEIHAAVLKITERVVPSQDKSSFTDFANFCRSNPGEYCTQTLADSSFIPARWQHFLTIWLGISAGAIKLVPRSIMEGYNFRRYLSFSWQRSFPLVKTITDQTQIIIRPAGVQEVSRIRPNEAKYLPCHGMSLNYYGTVETRSNFLWQLGLSFDPKAACTDNTVCDIEKIAREVEFLNGEASINVVQSSHRGSSIPNTQHTHQSEGDVDSVLLFQETNSPTFLPALNGTIDLVQVGAKQDAIFIKLISETVVSDEFLSYLIDLRVHLQAKFGFDNLDIHVHILPGKLGEFVTIMVAFVKLTANIDPATGLCCYTNPDTGVKHRDIELLAQLQMTNPTGVWGIDPADIDFVNKLLNNGRQALAEIFDFAAKPGLREAVQEYVGLPTNILSKKRRIA